MKKITIGALVLLSTMSVNAQIAMKDSLEMGNNYVNDMYYNLETSEKLTRPGNEWHIAFATSKYSVGITTNYALPSLGMGQAALVVKKHPNSTGDDFATVDTLGFSTWEKLYDDSLDFELGAFNHSSGSMNYGWGSYNMTTHVIEGNSTYIILIGEVAYKLQVLSKNNGVWAFRYGTIESTQPIEKIVDAFADYGTKTNIYFNFETGEFIDRELEGWDLVATKYNDFYNGTAVNQSVTGILHNPKWKVARVNAGTTPRPEHYDFSAAIFSEDKNEIGQSYKELNGYSWAIDDAMVYYLQNEEGDVWKIYMTNFVGAGAGKTVFYKQKMATAGIDDAEQVQFLDIYPNPSANQITIAFDSKGSDAQVVIRNQMGQIVTNKLLDTTIGIAQTTIDISNLSNGIYLVEINQGNGSIVKSVVKY